MTDRASILRMLHAVGGNDDGDIDLADTALLLAALDRPDADLGLYRAYLKDLNRDLGVEATLAESLAERRRTLRTVLAEAHEYKGDSATYEDMQNANLMRVIDRRRGLPVALGILYIQAARAQGWEAAGLNVPAHFLIRLSDGSEHAILDPFNGGRTVDPARIGGLLGLPGAEMPSAGDFQAMSNRDVLLRLQNNIKVRALQAKDLERAVAVLESMFALSPEIVPLWWEAAVHLEALDRPGAAAKIMQDCLDHPAVVDPPKEIEDFIRRMRRKLN